MIVYWWITLLTAISNAQQEHLYDEVERGLVFAYSFDLIPVDEGRIKSRIRQTDEPIHSLLMALRNKETIVDLEEKFSTLFPSWKVSPIVPETVILSPQDDLASIVSLGISIAQSAFAVIYALSHSESQVSSFRLPNVEILAPAINSTNHTEICIYNILNSGYRYLQKLERYPSQTVDICLPRKTENRFDFRYSGGVLSSDSLLLSSEWPEIPLGWKNPRISITHCTSMYGSDDGSHESCPELDPWACTTGGGCYVNSNGDCDWTLPGYYSESGDWFPTKCDTIPSDQYFVAHGWTDPKCPSRCLGDEKYLSSTGTCEEVPMGFFNSPCDNDPGGIYPCYGGQVMADGMLVFDPQASLCSASLVGVYLLPLSANPVSSIRTWIRILSLSSGVTVGIFGVIGEWILGLSEGLKIVYCESSSVELVQCTSSPVSPLEWFHASLVRETGDVQINGSPVTMTYSESMEEWGISMLSNRSSQGYVGRVHFGPIFPLSDHVNISLYNSIVNKSWTMESSYPPGYFRSEPCLYGSRVGDTFCKADYILDWDMTSTTSTSVTTTAVESASHTDMTTVSAFVDTATESTTDTTTDVSTVTETTMFSSTESATESTSASTTETKADTRTDTITDSSTDMTTTSESTTESTTETTPTAKTTDITPESTTDSTAQSTTETTTDTTTETATATASNATSESTTDKKSSVPQETAISASNKNSSVTATTRTYTVNTTDTVVGTTGTTTTMSTAEASTSDNIYTTATTTMNTTVSFIDAVISSAKFTSTPAERSFSSITTSRPPQYITQPVSYSTIFPPVYIQTSSSTVTSIDSLIPSGTLMQHNSEVVSNKPATASNQQSENHIAGSITTIACIAGGTALMVVTAIICSIKLLRRRMARRVAQ